MKGLPFPARSFLPDQTENAAVSDTRIPESDTGL